MKLPSDFIFLIKTIERIILLRKKSRLFEMYFDLTLFKVRVLLQTSLGTELNSFGDFFFEIPV